ncbi:MAG: type II secretion system protein [Verrucomicrobia bacterium]|nr:type II secretion system protein [Verrucomicrobiota bacterium]
MKRERYGFTLIELLVVIAIIGILASIMLPVLASARTRAKINTCKVNMLQFSRDIDMYKINWDQAYPSYLSNLLRSKDTNLPTPKNYICPLDWTDGKDGGVPDKVKNTNTLFLKDAQYDETDDTELNTDYKDWRNQRVKRCSYLYEFCAAICSWDPESPQRPWYVVKEEQMKKGADGKYAGGHVPIVRCFWHGKQQKDGTGYIKDKQVLNVAVTDRNVFNSSAKWEDDL